LNRKMQINILLITVLLFSALFSIEEVKADSSLFYENKQYLVIENITLRGDGTGVGLTLKDCSHVALYNIHIENFAIGIKIENGLANNIYNPQLTENKEIGLLITGDYGITRVFGGSIIANGIGVKITNSAIMNQFYGTELELNLQNEVTFGESTYGNLFEGCYFERADSTSDNFLDMTNTLGKNTFYTNKFASQIASRLEVFGDSNVFRDNIFDSGTVSLSISGTKNVFSDNRQGEVDAEIIISDPGTNTEFKNNFFISDDSPQLPTNSPKTPEYSSVAILLLLIAIVLIATVIWRKKYPQKSLL